MGKATRAKSERKQEAAKRAGTRRLHMVILTPHYVDYDDRGRATAPIPAKPEYLMEAVIPTQVLDLLRARGGKFVTIKDS